MPRIPATEIERLKAEVSVERLVEASGIDLKRGGKDMLGRCPFHEDATASLVVTPASNLWHCFGCGVGGGPVDWVMKRRGVSFRHAVELLREGVVPLAADAGVLNNPSLRVLPPPVAFDADDQALLNQTVGYYHDRLLATTEAQAYMAGRGLAHAELVVHFKLDVADCTLGLRSPEKARKAGADIRSRLQKLGLYRDSGHKQFNGSLVVPVFDEAGNAVEVYGRKLLDDLRAGSPSTCTCRRARDEGAGCLTLKKDGHRPGPRAGAQPECASTQNSIRYREPVLFIRPQALEASSKNALAYDGWSSGPIIDNYVGGNPLSGIDPSGLDVMVITGGVRDGSLNFFGHTGSAVQGYGMASYGNDTPLGSSVGAYLSSQSACRAQQVTIVPTTSQQDAAATAFIKAHPDVNGVGKLDNCAVRTNQVLNAAGISTNAVPFPGGLARDVQGLPGATTYFIPQGGPIHPELCGVLGKFGP